MSGKSEESGDDDLDQSESSVSSEVFVEGLEDSSFDNEASRRALEADENSVDFTPGAAALQSNHQNGNHQAVDEKKSDDEGSTSRHSYVLPQLETLKVEAIDISGNPDQMPQDDDGPVAVTVSATYVTPTISSPSSTPIVSTSDENNSQGQDSTRMNAKLFPSLMVTLKPCLQPNNLTAAACAKLRAELDKEIKKVQLLFPNELTEWLIRQGLIRSEQKCDIHLDSQQQPSPFKLIVFSDSSKFPISGGFVWVSDCCDERHISVFSGSLFEKVPHTPKTMLKLLYHWTCQTSPINISQWVQVDMNYIKNFHASMRALCTCVVHEKLRGLGGKQKEVEVAIMTLGTSSNDGRLKQVKVEILGVLDQEKNIVRLLAVEPTEITPGAPTTVKRDYHQILAPMVDWVDKESIIVTDLSIDKNCLNELGFINVRQTSPNTSSGNILKIVEYISTSIPQSFQNVLSVLNLVTIQQFLNEMTWREKFGSSPMQAFKNVVSHIAELTKLEHEETLMAMFSRISKDPFQVWDYKNACKKPDVPPSPNPFPSLDSLPVTEE